MAKKKEVTYESHPDRYYYRPGTTEPELRPEYVGVAADDEPDEDEDEDDNATDPPEQQGGNNKPSKKPVAKKK